MSAYVLVEIVDAPDDPAIPIHLTVKAALIVRAAQVGFGQKFRTADMTKAVEALGQQYPHPDLLREALERLT